MLESSSFVEAVELVVLKLLYALVSSSFVAIMCSALVLFKLLNLLLKLLSRLLNLIERSSFV